VFAELDVLDVICGVINLLTLCFSNLLFVFICLIHFSYDFFRFKFVLGFLASRVVICDPVVVEELRCYYCTLLVFFFYMRVQFVECCYYLFMVVAISLQFVYLVEICCLVFLLQINY